MDKASAGSLGKTIPTRGTDSPRRRLAQPCWFSPWAGKSGKRRSPPRSLAPNPSKSDQKTLVLTTVFEVFPDSPSPYDDGLFSSLEIL